MTKQLDFLEAIPTSLKCYRCHKTKLIKEFARNSHARKGLCCNCKECQRILRKERRLKLDLGRVPIESKQCVRCKETKPVSEFDSNLHNTDGFTTYCKECKYRRQSLKTYNLSPQESDMIFKGRSGKCAIGNSVETAVRNGRVRKLSIDHSHKTGKVRGLLCQRCNSALGLARDDSSILRKMAEYLESFDT